MTTVRTYFGNGEAFGYEQITTLESVQALTVPLGSRAMIIQCEGTNVRWRDDGVDPTATVGMLLRTGDDLVYEGPHNALIAIRLIQLLIGGKLNVIYWG